MKWSTRTDWIESERGLTMVLLSSQLAGPAYTGQSVTTTFLSPPTSSITVPRPRSSPIKASPQPTSSSAVAKVPP